MKFWCLITVFSLTCYFLLTPLLAWGPLTHISTAFEAGKDGSWPVSEKFLGAYLAGATEPDIGNLGASSKKFYPIFHDPAYVEAMLRVASRKKSPEKEELVARALGMKAHIAADRVAHSASGLANQVKLLYNGDEVSNDRLVEWSCDMLLYRENRQLLSKYRLDFIDPATLQECINEYGKSTGKNISVNKLELETLIARHQAVCEIEMTIARKLIKENPKIFDEMNSALGPWRENKDGCVGRAITDIRALNSGRIPATDPGDSRSSKEKASSIGYEILEKITGTGLEAGSTLGIKIADIDFIGDKLREIALKKFLSSRRDGPAFDAILLLSYRDDISFHEALYLSQSNFIPTTQEEIIKKLEAELLALEEMTARAKEAYEKRAWWKIWLYFTDSDRKKYEEYRMKLEARRIELEKVRKKPASNSDFQPVMEPLHKNIELSTSLKKPVSPSTSPDSAELLKLRIKVEEAYSSYLRAIEKGDRALIRKTLNEFNLLNEKYRKAMKIE